jgi:hypothetical protein
MADDPNANPAAQLYEQTLFDAGLNAAVIPQYVGDDTFTITGTLSGGFAGPSAAVASSGSASWDWNEIFKLAVITVIAAWIGSALLGRKDK